MKSKPFPLFAVVRNTLLASLTLCGVGQAADQTWLAANSNNNWSTSDSNWLGAVAWTQGNNAIFGGTGETVTLTEGISVGNITFTSGGYTIAGNTLTLGSSTIATGNNNATISSVLAGTSLTKTGSGTLALSAATTYAGGTTISAGSLNLDFSAATAPTSNILLSTSALTLNGGTLLLTGKSSTTNNQTVPGLSLATGTASAISLNANSATALNLALGGITRNAGATANFTLPTAGSITTSAVNTSGILGTWATVGSGTSTKYATVSSGAIAALTGTAAATAANLTDTTGLVNYDLAAATGTVPATVSANTIRYTGGAATTAPGATSFRVNGLLNAGSGLWTIGTNALTIGANQDLVINTANNGITISGNLNDNGGGASALTKTGASTLTLSGTSNYTGLTRATAGTLQFGKASSFYNSATGLVSAVNAGKLTVANGATAAFNVGGATEFDATDLGTLLTASTGGAGFLPGSSLGLDTTNAGGDFTYGSVIADTANGSLGLVKLGTGSLTLSGGTANTYSGTTTVKSGALILSKSANTAAVSGNLAIYGNAANVWPTADNQLGSSTLVSNGNAAQWACFTLLGTTQTIGGLDNTANNLMVANSTTANAIMPSPTGTGTGVLILAGSGNYVFGGDLWNAWNSVAGTGGTLGLTLNMGPGGSQTLSGVQITYTGATTVNSGTLNLQGASAFTSATTVNNGGTLMMTNSGNQGMNAAITLNNGAILTHNGLTNNGDFWTNSQAVTVASGAAVTLNENSVANTVGTNKGMFVDGGLKGGGSGAVVTINAANAGNSVIFRAQSGVHSNFAGKIIVNGIASTTNNAGSGIGVSGEDTGLQNADIELNGTMELANQSAGGLGWATNNTAFFTMGALSGNGVVTSNGQTRTLILGNTNTPANFPGSLANGSLGSSLLNLTKTGTGTQTLSGANTYTGATTISGGSLVLSGASGALGTTSAITIGTGATLKLDNTGAVNSGVRLNDSAVLALTGGTLQFSNDAAAGVSFSETVGVVSASLGGTIATSQAASGQTSTLTLVGLTGTANFSGTGLGAADGRNKILIPGQANGSMVGTINSTGIAVYDTTLGVTEAVLTSVPFGGTINDGPSTNIRLAGGTSGNVLLGSDPTSVNTILQNQTSATVIQSDSKILRLGASGGIQLPTGTASLTIGASVNDGTLTAGGADNTPGTLNLTNNDGTALLTINSAIANNGASGAVGVVTGGAGKVVLAGTNTYTGTTYLGATTTEFSGATQTLPGIISGSGALLKTNAASTLTLTGVNTYTGGTTVNAGTLQLSYSVTSPNNSSSYTIGSGATLKLNNTSATTNTTSPIWSKFTGSGTLALATAKTFDTGWNTAALGSGFTGTLQIEGGRVTLANASNLGGTTNIVVKSGGHLGIWQGGTYGQDLTIAGIGYGEGSGYNGAIRFGNPGVTTTINGNVTLAGNTTLVASTGGFGVINGNISDSPTSDLTIGSTSGVAGTIVMNGTNTYTGNTNIAFGTLLFGKPVSFYNANQPSWSKLVVNSGSTAAFNVGGAGEFTSLDIDTVKGLTNVAAGVPATTGFKNGSILGLDTTNANLGNFAYASIIGDHVAGATTDTLGLAKLGTGTLTLNSANTYTGATRIVGGVLSVGTLANAGTPSDIGAASNVAANLVFAGGNLQYTGATASTNRSFTLSAAAGIEVTQGATTLTIANTINAAGGNQILTKSGNGVLVLGGSADNSSMFFAVSTGETRLDKSANGVRAMAGITSVAAGATVKLTGTGTDQIYGGNAAANYGVNGLAGTLDLNGHSESTSNFNGTSAGLVTNSASATNVTWTVGETDATSSFAGIIQNGAGTVALTKIGINTQTLSGTSTQPEVSAKRLIALQLDGVSAAGSGLITLGDGSTGTNATRLLANVGSGTFANDITVSTNGTGTATLEQSQNLSQLSGLITLNRATTITHSNNDRAGISGKITGNVGTLTFNGGRTTLDNTVASDFTGNIVINTGALQTNGMVNCLPATASLTINGTSIFQLNNGRAQTINALNGGTSANTGVQIIAGAATSLTIGAGGGNGNFAGKIINSAAALSIIKSGAGTQELSAVNTYSGGTTIRDGALVLTGGSDRLLPTGSVTLGDVATSGKLVLGNATAASNQTFAGIATTGLGGSVVGANAATDSVLTLSIASSATFGGSLGGAGSNENKLALTKTGAGSLTLNGASTYSGGTTVQTGSLILGNTSGSGTGSGAVAMQTGTTLGGTGSASGATTIASGAIVAPGTNIGTLTLGSATLAGTYQCQLNGTTGDRLTVTGALTVSPGAAITVSTLAAPTASSFTILSYGSLTGTLPTITPPSGYTVDTSTPGQVKLVKTGSYSAWAITNAPTGTPTSDYDGDGVSNALEWVLGGLASTKDLAKLPAVSTSGGNLIFTFVRNDAAWQSGDTTVQIETGTTLANWPAVYNVGVDTASSSAGVTVTNNGSTDTITLTVPQAPDAKKFARLKVTVATP